MPKSGLYISFQIAPMTMPGIRIGSRNTVRYTMRPAITRVTNKARKKPMTISAPTDRIANNIVLKKPARTSGSCRSSAKWRSPAKVHCAVPWSQRMSLTDITSRFTIGSAASSR